VYEKRIVIVGYSSRGVDFIRQIIEDKNKKLKIIGYVHIDEPNRYNQIIHLGGIDDLLLIAREHGIDEIVVAKVLEEDSRLDDMLEQCQEMGLTITMLLNLKNKKSAKVQVTMCGTLPTLTLHTVSLNQKQLLAKRLLDIIGATVGLVFLGIAFIIFAPLIKIESRGPVLFKQKRVGRNGRVFQIYKFRSMGVNAEFQKAALLADNQMTGNMFKIENDPRVTLIGAILRKTSIDELPQFINVIKGDMSLVGTRPPTVDEVKNYELHHHKRISIMPGITGNWQVSGRSQIKDFEEVVRLDTKYIDEFSIKEDLKIILKTVYVVFNKHGSY
jgi:exopolysaccharide biosynthesis polyprenyl glycosylphosphotransferase